MNDSILLTAVFICVRHLGCVCVRARVRAQLISDLLSLPAGNWRVEKKKNVF